MDKIPCTDTFSEEIDSNCSHMRTSLKQGVLESQTADTWSKNACRGMKMTPHPRKHQKLDSARIKLSLLAKKHFLTKNCLDDVEASLAEIGNSINSLQKLDRLLAGEGDKKKAVVSIVSSSTCDDHLTTLNNLIAESQESIDRLQKEIQKYQTKSSPNADEEHLAEAGSETRQSSRSSSRLSTHHISPSALVKQETESKSSRSYLEDQLNVYRRQNKETFLEEWQYRKQHMDKISELEKLKTRVRECRGHVTSDEVFNKLFEEWLEVRSSETYLKTQKLLFNQTLKQLQHHNAVNLLESEKCEKASKELAELEEKVLANQKLLQELFHDVSTQSKTIENNRKSAQDCIERKLIPSLILPEPIAQLPNTGCRILEFSQKCTFDAADLDSFPDTSSREKKFQNISYFRNSLKHMLNIPTSSLDSEIVKEVLKLRKKKSVLRSQLQQMPSSFQSQGSIDGVGKTLSDIREDLRCLQQLQSEQSAAAKIKANASETKKVLSNIKHSLLELEEGAQYSVPWISIDGVNYRQYVQLMRHANSGHTL